MGFFVFLVFQRLEIEDSSEQVLFVDFSSDSLQTAFYAITVGLNFSVVSEGDNIRPVPRKELTES